MSGLVRCSLKTGSCLRLSIFTVQCNTRLLLVVGMVRIMESPKLLENYLLWMSSYPVNPYFIPRF